MSAVAPPSSGCAGSWWLGVHGGMRATPETSPTADLEWVEPRKDLIS